MKRYAILLTICFFFFGLQYDAYGAVALPGPAQSIDIAQQHSMPGDLSANDWLNLKPKEIAKRTGQKMGFFKRLMLKVVQKKIKKQMKKARKAGDDTKPLGSATASVILGSAGLVLIFFISYLALPLSILAMILGGIALGRGDESGLGALGLMLGIGGCVVWAVCLSSLF